jgi:hypothetical protein
VEGKSKMDSSTNGKKHPWLMPWIKQPGSWLSVVAAIISVSTFYLVYAKKGEVRVIMPDKVGVSLSNGSALLLIPVTFTNTGAPRTVNHVTHVTATLRKLDPQEVAGNEVGLHWRFELKTIGKFQYLQTYPDRKDEEKNKKGDVANNDDYVDYVSRTFPFALYGGTSVNKLFDFVQDAGVFQRSLRSFELEVRAETDSKAVSSQVVKYFCEGEELRKDYRYCLRSYQ